MIYKRIMLLLLLLNVAACSSVSSLLGQDVAPNNEAEDTRDKEANEQALESSSLTGSLSSEQLLAQSLINQSDLYQSSKQTLASKAKRKVVTALNEFNSGAFEQSERSINQVLVTELDLNSAVYVLAGDIALANNKQEEAVRHYRQALKLNDHNAKAANRLAMQLRQQGEFTQAEALYSQAINAQPGQAESYRNRAVLYDLYVDEKAKALQDYEAYSALINYSLSLYERSESAEFAHTNEAETNAAPLSDKQLKLLKTNIKLVKRWLIDVGRQVDAIARAGNNGNNSGGN